MSNQSNDFNTPPELVTPIKDFWGGKIDKRNRESAA